MIRTALPAILLGVATTAAECAAPALPLAFAHADHRSVNCIACHHNFADTTGQGECLFCHRTNAELAAVIEAQFHRLCRGCHVDTRRRGDDAGPVRRCTECHQPDTAF